MLYFFAVFSNPDSALGVFVNRIVIVSLYATHPQYDPIMFHKSTRMYYALSVFVNRTGVVRSYTTQPQYEPVSMFLYLSALYLRAFTKHNW